jgi:hypothetical protein
MKTPFDKIATRIIKEQELSSVYINIFSCKDFDAEKALKFCMNFWRAKKEVHNIVVRT